MCSNDLLTACSHTPFCAVCRSPKICSSPTVSLTARIQNICKSYETPNRVGQTLSISCQFSTFPFFKLSACCAPSLLRTACTRMYQKKPVLGKCWGVAVGVEINGHNLSLWRLRFCKNLHKLLNVSRDNRRSDSRAHYSTTTKTSSARHQLYLYLTPMKN